MIVISRLYGRFFSQFRHYVNCVAFWTTGLFAGHLIFDRLREITFRAIKCCHSCFAASKPCYRISLLCRRAIDKSNVTYGVEPIYSNELFAIRHDRYIRTNHIVRIRLFLPLDIFQRLFLDERRSQPNHFRFLDRLLQFDLFVENPKRQPDPTNAIGRATMKQCLMIAF